MEFNRNYGNEYENGSRTKDFLKKQGFYVVLFICLLIVGTAIALTAFPRDQAENQNVSAADPTPVVIETRKSSDETLAGKSTPLPTVTPAPATPSPSPTPKAASSSANSVKKGAAPVSGEIIWGYAADQLLYSRTLDQWTTHAAVDLSAEIGSDVKAALAGTVEKVYEDDALGQIVTIAHTNDRVSLYGNLDANVAVTVGQKVNAGDVIGKVGKTAVSECAELPHLHFAFLVAGVPANPTDHVNIPH